MRIDRAPVWKGIMRGAQLSACEKYRYLLWRYWDDALPPMLWVMLNPSTADAERDDATIRTCMTRAQRMGYGGIEAVNLFALRATNPEELYRAAYPVSDPDDPGRNDWEIGQLLHRRQVICAWGTHGGLLSRRASVLEILRRAGIQPRALRMTKSGHPGHPLYVPHTQPLIYLSMKPRIAVYRTKLDVQKWRCTSEEAGQWGPYLRQGCGYTPEEAYRKWRRYGRFYNTGTFRPEVRTNIHDHPVPVPQGGAPGPDRAGLVLRSGCGGLGAEAQGRGGDSLPLPRARGESLPGRVG